MNCELALGHHTAIHGFQCETNKRMYLARQNNDENPLICNSCSGIENVLHVEKYCCQTQTKYVFDFNVSSPIFG